MSAHPPAGLDGPGTHTLAMGVKNGQVVLEFERPVLWVALDAETARNVAERLARDSYKARFGDDPSPQRRSQISDMKVTALRLRVRNMLKAMDGQDHAIVANAVVDALLQEVL